MNTIKCYLHFTQLLTNKINMNMYVYICVYIFFTLPRITFRASYMLDKNSASELHTSFYGELSKMLKQSENKEKNRFKEIIAFRILRFL